MSLINNGESYPVPQGIDNTQLQFKCHIRRGNAELDNCNEYEQCRLSGTFRRYTQNCKLKIKRLKMFKGSSGRI